MTMCLLRSPQDCLIPPTSLWHSAHASSMQQADVDSRFRLDAMVSMFFSSHLGEHLRSPFETTIGRMFTKWLSRRSRGRYEALAKDAEEGEKTSPLWWKTPCVYDS